VSVLAVDRPETRADMLAASRTIQALLIAYELDAGHPLQTVIIAGGR